MPTGQGAPLTTLARTLANCTHRRLSGEDTAPTLEGVLTRGAPRAKAGVNATSVGSRELVALASPFVNGHLQPAAHAYCARGVNDRLANDT